MRERDCILGGQEGRQVSGILVYFMGVFEIQSSFSCRRDILFFAGEVTLVVRI